MKGIVIHHSATADSGTKSWDAIRRYHVEVNGWRDIGYHFGVERVGDRYQVFGGRPVHESGAHTAGHNDQIGICLVGDFDTEPPPPEALHTLFRLVLGLVIAFGLTPENVHFHNQYAPKSCPGEKFPQPEFLGKLRAACARVNGGR